MGRSRVKKCSSQTALYTIGLAYTTTIASQLLAKSSQMIQGKLKLMCRLFFFMMLLLKSLLHAKLELLQSYIAQPCVGDCTQQPPHKTSFLDTKEHWCKFEREVSLDLSQMPGVCKNRTNIEP